MKGFIRRVVPFLAALTIGLLIASLFVSVSAPSFEFKRSWKNHSEYHRTMERENRQLRRANYELKRRIAEMERRNLENRLSLDFDSAVPPPPPSELVPYKPR